MTDLRRRSNRQNRFRQPGLRSTPRLRCCRLGAVAALCALIGLVPTARAQRLTLDEAMLDMLGPGLGAGVCVNLLAGDTLSTSIFGPNLFDICDVTGQITGGGGGGAGALPGSTDALAQRLKERTERDDDEETARTNSVDLGGGTAAFFTLNYDSLDKQVTKYEAGFDSDVIGLTLGLDHFIRDQLVVGAAFNYVRNQGDYDASGGEFDTNAYGLLAFASYAPWEGSFVDLFAGYARRDTYNRRRVWLTSLPCCGPGNPNVSGYASGETDANEYSLGGVLGHDFAFSNVTVGPRAEIRWQRTDINAYSETGGTGLELRYDEQEIDSLLSSIGGEVSMAFSTSFGVLVPRVGANYVHEFLDDQREIHISFVEDLRASPTRFSFWNEVPERNYFELKAGVVATLPKGFSAFADFRALLGNNQFDSFGGSVGVRLEI